MPYGREKLSNALLVRDFDAAFPVTAPPYEYKGGFYKNWRLWAPDDLDDVARGGGSRYLSAIYYAFDEGYPDLAKRVLPNYYRGNLAAFGRDVSRVLRAPVPQVVVDMERGIVPVGYTKTSDITPELQQQLLDAISTPEIRLAGDTSSVVVPTVPSQPIAKEVSGKVA